MSRIMDLWKLVIIPFLLLITFFLTLAIFKSEIVSVVTLLICIIITFTVKHNDREWLLIIIGTMMGLILEIGGDLVYKLQYWENGSLFGLPLWLPLLWGYAFVIIYRVGNIIIKK